MYALDILTAAIVVVILVDHRTWTTYYYTAVMLYLQTSDACIYTTLKNTCIRHVIRAVVVLHDFIRKTHC